MIILLNLCINIYLAPRNFKYKVVHKKRTYRTFKQKKLIYGTCGLFCLAPVILTSKHLFRFTLLMKKAARRADKTFRKFWIYIFPTLPLTRKSVGLRMGKGKGKRQTWQVTLRPGTALFETRNLRFGRAVHFFLQLQARLPVPIKIISKPAAPVLVYHFSATQTRVFPFW